MYIEVALIKRRLHHSTFGACSEPGRDMEGLRFSCAIIRLVFYMVEICKRTNMSKAVCKKRSISTHPKRGYPFTFLISSS